VEGVVEQAATDKWDAGSSWAERKRWAGGIEYETGRRGKKKRRKEGGIGLKKKIRWFEQNEKRGKGVKEVFGN
jgi:hypothetical protein